VFDVFTDRRRAQDARSLIEREEGSGTRTLAPLNVHNGWRRSTAVGYLKPNLSRKNLELMTSTRVRRILFDGVPLEGLPGDHVFVCEAM
jgi:choline dehydrogenase-like flavoprotein